MNSVTLKLENCGKGKGGNDNARPRSGRKKKRSQCDEIELKVKENSILISVPKIVFSFRKNTILLL